jgi:hypothetical protein
MKNTLLFLLVITTIQLYGQFSRQNIVTDSSDIEVIRNSVYKVYEETFKYKDSVWYSVRYINDTTQIHSEGWKRKSGQHLGIWSEYTREGELLYTWNHDKGICTVNSKLFPYHSLLENIKKQADKLIENAYGKDFMNNHVVFNYNCYAYFGHLEKFGTDSLWMQDYVGSWIEPMKQQPNSYKLRYEVRLNKSDNDWIELGMDFDSLGNYIPSRDDTYNNYGFEEIKNEDKTFKINKLLASKIAKGHGLILTDSSKINEFLIWENFKKQKFYNGQFRYYITDLKSQTEYSKNADRKGIIYRYDVYVFNPWTGEFIEKKKMKARREWGRDSGHSTGLMKDND